VKKNELLFAMMELNAASDKVSREDVEFHDLVSLKDLILERGGFFNFLGGNS